LFASQLDYMSRLYEMNKVGLGSMAHSLVDFLLDILILLEARKVRLIYQSVVSNAGTQTCGPQLQKYRKMPHLLSK